MNQYHFKAAVEFGKKLITTGDLDPVYIAVYQARLDQETLARWMLAYSCLYHLSASMYLSQYKGNKFWDKLMEAAVNEGLKWPRGSERRHWRGQACVNAVAWMRKELEQPEAAMDAWKASLGKLTCDEVIYNVKQFPLCGPWVSFKIADLLERVAGVPVDFSKFELGIYSEPRKGAALLWLGEQEIKISDEELKHVVTRLLEILGRFKAPPSNNRLVNVAEIETVLCKYKSHVNGHYPLGKDTLEVFHGLEDTRFQCGLVKRSYAAIAPLTRQWKEFD